MLGLSLVRPTLTPGGVLSALFEEGEMAGMVGESVERWRDREGVTKEKTLVPGPG